MLLCNVLVLLMLVAFGSCAVWTTSEQQGQVEPQEINVEQYLSAGQEQADLEMTRLFRRQSSPDIGFTQHLNDTHLHGLVHWTGHPSEVLFILTRSQVNGPSSESWLWRSTDYGHSFSNDTVKWNNDTVIQWYYIAPLNEYLIFSDRIHRTLWVTTDEGETYTSYPLPFTPDNFRFQSTRAPGSDSARLSKYVLGYDSGQQSLWVSHDLGQSWQFLGRNVTRYAWRILNTTYEEDTAVYFEQAINSTHSRLYSSRYPYEQQNTQLFGGLDPFLTNTFVLSNEYMFVQMNTSSSAQYSSPLWVSRNRRFFRQARFPLQTQERHYAVVDTSEGQVFIAVYHDINSTHLYLSEVEGLNYTLSLNYLISPPEDEWQSGYPSFDMHVVEGIVGTFIANIKDPASQYGSTVISYDKGGNWASLRPPTVDRNGAFLNCQPPECSLHLQIQANRQNGYQSILSQDSAIGLIMAMGNLGSVLSTSNFRLRLYFSQDGGFTWSEVDSGLWQFQFAGQGAVVAAIRRYRYTSSVNWSCNEGRTWDTVNFLGSDSQLTSIQSIGMLTERGERALHVTVFGIRFPFAEWIVVDLNFTSVLPNQCTQSDFFTWIPTDDRPGSRCLLGEVIQYERRNSSTCCYADPNSSRLISRDTCNCTREDFECDFGFERIHLNSPCTPLPDFSWPPLQPDPCPENTTYTISSGYRRVAGDKCTPGDELSFFPIQRPCIVGQPDAISLQTNSSVYLPHIPVQFTLSQLLGGKLMTRYRWDFNDSSSVVNMIGYEQSRIQVHTFNTPGVYNVTITITNAGGTYLLPYTVTVIDPVSHVSIVHPFQLSSRSELPAGVDLVFGSQVTTQFSTTLTGDLQYLWNFGDTSPPANGPGTKSHTFTQPGSYVVTLTVLSVGTAAVSTSSLNVEVLDGITSVHVTVPAVLVAGQQSALTSQVLTEYSTTNTGQVKYKWDFGDGTSSFPAQANVQHQYASPGNYTLTLNASNIFSWRATAVELLVFDTLVTVSITPLIQLTGNQLPTQLRVVFQADVTTQFSTELTGALQYSWDFGDGAVQPSSGPTTSHTFTREANVTVSCTVTSPASSIQTQRVFSVFEASQSVQIISAALIRDLYVKTNQVAEFNVMSANDSGHIPPDTHYTWHMIPGPAVSCANATRDETLSNVYQVTFPCYGVYDVSVVGNHSAGSFVAQLHIIAEAVINYISVGGIPAVVRSGAVLTLAVHIGESASIPYEGPLIIAAVDANLTGLASTTEAPQGVGTLKVELSRDQISTPVKTVLFVAGNAVSIFNKSVPITLAVEGDYGELRLLFLTSQLPSNYTSKRWQAALTAAVTVKLETYLTAYPDSYVEIEGVGFTHNATTTTEVLTKRQERQEFLYVDVNLLPQTLQPEDTVAIRNVSMKVQEDVSSSSFTVTVQDSTVTVTAIEIRDAGPEVVIHDIVQPVNWRLYTGVGVGLGVGLLLVVVIAVILGAALYTYKKRYSRLNVRYARLRQTPVRFTFTQGGEMVEEEDYEGPDSPDEEEEEGHTNNSDVKMKIVQ